MMMEMSCVVVEEGLEKLEKLLGIRRFHLFLQNFYLEPQA